ncbi:recombinase family protein [Ktedonobacter sp. SOSP1-52]|uniref:recombinase family protein n=1 Tax=Ktedonobacter sp. SOSP1-52 TaxID=2778366 RepID=UPI0019164928|nr:recombinase family protein [Ktedonobacter sp. SOSP1-52]
MGLSSGSRCRVWRAPYPDWHQLLELCALFHTLIADLDGIYDPTQYNDRLLLGLKGTMSEAELHVLKQRMHQGRLSKAQRGELQFALPVGYVWSPTGEIQFDPDEQVQQVVRFLFRKFEELGTLGGLVRYLAHHQIQLGIRVREGPGKGELVWRRPNRATIQMMLRHPLYAGSYVYGRRQEDPRRKQPERPRTGRVVMTTDEWLVLLPNRCPAYISPEQYEHNQARLQANRARADAMGVARGGPALLAGLVVCARCGCRLNVHYDNGGDHLHTYECIERWTHYGEPKCQHLAGPCLDTFVSQQVLAALEPAALELSLTVTERVEQERAELDRLWQQRRERAAYEAERAARQYHAVEPEHRLVARTLEHAWEEKLADQQQLEEEYHRFVQQKPRVLSDSEREAIRRLATDIPAIWAAPTTMDADRKEILRQVIERVIVDVQGTSEQVKVRIEWIGGSHTEGVVIRPIGKLSELSTYPQICHQVQVFTEAGWAAVAIAQALNDAGFRPPRSTTGFRTEMISQLQRQLGVKAPRPRVRHHEWFLPDEWWPAELARHLHIPRGTLLHWIRQGVIRARQLDEPLHRWVVWADEAEQERLRAYHQRAIGDDFRHRWTDAPLAEQP